jgi:hypothetical protein
MESMPELKERFIDFVQSTTDRIGNALPTGSLKSSVKGIDDTDTATLQTKHNHDA